MSRITTEEWTAELARLTQDDPGNTVHELAQRAGMTDAAMRAYLDRGAKEGRYLVGKARRPGIKGRLNVYRLAPPPAASRRKREKPTS